MTDRTQTADAIAQQLRYEVKLLAELMWLCRVTLLYGDAGTQRDLLLRSSIAPLLQDLRPSGQTELVILFDAWDRAPLGALHAKIHAALAQISSTPTPASGQSLAAALRSWQEAHNVTFLIIFDCFDEYLVAPLERDGIRQFEEEFVQIVNDTTLRANFLLVLGQDSWPLLERLRHRVPRLGNDCVRLLSASQPLGDAASGIASSAEQNAGNEPPLSADAAEIFTSRADLTGQASIHRSKGAPAFAIALLMCALVAGVFWFGQRTSGPVASVAEQRPTPPQGAQVSAGERSVPAKVLAEAEEPARVSTSAHPKEQAAPQPIATEEHSAPAPTVVPRTEPTDRPQKPQTTATRRGKAPVAASQSVDKAGSPLIARPVVLGADVQLSEPPAPPAEPTHAAISQPTAPPPLTIDQVYEERTAKECERGVSGLVCRQKIRFQLCAGKWTKGEPPGMTRCNTRPP